MTRVTITLPLEEWQLVLSAADCGLADLDEMRPTAKILARIENAIDNAKPPAPMPGQTDLVEALKDHEHCAEMGKCWSADEPCAAGRS